MTRNSLQKWFLVATVTTLFVALWLSDWLRSLGFIFTVEPMRLINIVLTVVLAITGLCQWARGQQRFRNYLWLRHRSIAWIHRSAGLFYVLLIVFWDLLFETENASTAENAILETLNKPLLAVLVLTALFLFLKWPRRILPHYKLVKWIHITAATIYVIKFFAEPLLGGKLG